MRALRICESGLRSLVIRWESEGGREVVKMIRTMYDRVGHARFSPGWRRTYSLCFGSRFEYLEPLMEGSAGEGGI